MPNRTQTLQRQAEALDKAEAEAFKAMQDAEDAIFEMEDREARRASSRTTDSKYPGATAGRSR